MSARPARSFGLRSVLKMARNDGENIVELQTQMKDAKDQMTKGFKDVNEKLDGLDSRFASKTVERVVFGLVTLLLIFVVNQVLDNSKKSANQPQIYIQVPSSPQPGAQSPGTQSSVGGSGSVAGGGDRPATSANTGTTKEIAPQAAAAPSNQGLIPDNVPLIGHIL